MTDTAETADLGLPYIMVAQAQKHVTHNEVLHALDVIVHLDATLVLVDGGVGTDWAMDFTALQTILCDLNHDRWLYIQRNDNLAGYSDGKDILTNADARRQLYTGDHFVPTLLGMQTGQAGSQADLIAVADGLWRPSLLNIPPDTLHPNAAGLARLAHVIHDALKARGWV